MMYEMFRAKIHRVKITDVNLFYEGSLTVDPDLLEAAGIFPNEKVQVANLSNGVRLETYTILGERGSGTIGLNGAAARLGHVGDEVIIIAYSMMNEEEAKNHKPLVVQVDEKNRQIK